MKSLNAARKCCLLMLALLVTLSVFANASQSDAQVMLKQLELLDQLDLLDKRDFDDALAEVYRCAEARNFKCSDAKLKEASLLAFDEQGREALSDAKQYRDDMHSIVEEEKKRLSQERLIAECSRRCPLSGEYRSCVAGDLRATRCQEKIYQESKSQAPNNMMILSQALQEFKNITDQHLAQQRQALEQQQAFYEQQRRQREEQEKRIQEQKREWQRRQSEQIALAEQRQQDLDAMQREAARKRAVAEEKRRKADEARIRAEKRRQEQEARRLQREQEKLQRQLAREREKAEKEARRQAYLLKLKQGIRMGGKTCYGEKHVWGVVPKVRPEEVACIDVSFRVFCPGSASIQHKGVMDTMISTGNGCFGDTEHVPSSIPCKAEEFRVEVSDVQGC